MASSLRINYPSAYESVAKARQAVGRFVEECGFGRAEVADIILAVGEACSNAVEHGHVDSGCFAVSCTCERGQLKIEIKDDGDGFDSSLVDAIIDPAACGGRGRGIAIMRALMDDVKFRKTRHGTSVTLRKRKKTRQIERGALNGGREAASEFRGLDAGRLR
jgi:anti-sigma regulatory factor (Ser/Thr protein kinase)